jgi:hypothetical protein
VSSSFSSAIWISEGDYVTLLFVLTGGLTSKQCNSFKTRALKIQDALKLAIPDLDIAINPEKV